MVSNNDSSLHHFWVDARKRHDKDRARDDRIRAVQNKTFKAKLSNSKFRDLND